MKSSKRLDPNNPNTTHQSVFSKFFLSNIVQNDCMPNIEIWWANFVSRFRDQPF